MNDRTTTADATRMAGTSGALTGGALGLASKVWGGSRSKAELLRAALGGAALGGGLAAGTTALGSGILGAPQEEDPTGYTRRGAIGGLVGGGAIGAGLGAAAARGKTPLPDNLIGDYFRKLIAQGGAKSLKRGALAGALGLGGLAAYFGADEGMQADVVQQEMVAKRRRALEEALGGAL